MVFESSLAQQATQFADSLNVRPAPTVEQSAEEHAQQTKQPEQHGDTVSISEEARALIAPEKPGESEQSEQEKDMDETIQFLKDRIEALEEEIQGLEKSDLPEKQKLTRIQDKQAQLMELRDQLLKAEQTRLKAEGLSSDGGTRANGFGSSLDDF